MITDIIFLPHGIQIIPGVEDEIIEANTSLDEHMHNMLTRVADSLDSENPKVILLTPHGYNLEQNLTLYEHDSFYGDIYKLSQNSVVLGEKIDEIEVSGDLEFSQKLKNKLIASDVSVEVLIHGYPSYPLKLNWGEIVPLYYLKKHIEARYTIMCYPRTRHSDLDHIDQLNKKIRESLAKLQEDIVLVVSGDLSHVHQEDGPYGFDSLSTEFDALINSWAVNPDENLMDKITKNQPTALACGYAGINLIHKIRKSLNYSLVEQFYEVPTYFGMGGYWWNIHTAKV